MVAVTALAESAEAGTVATGEAATEGLGGKAATAVAMEVAIAMGAVAAMATVVEPADPGTGVTVTVAMGGPGAGTATSQEVALASAGAVTVAGALMSAQSRGSRASRPAQRETLSSARDTPRGETPRLDASTSGRIFSERGRLPLSGTCLVSFFKDSAKVDALIATTSSLPCYRAA